MNSTINYTIIIPHYNIPELLLRCLHSIPVREDIQVIVVDDCSPDAARYQKDYPELSRPFLEFYSTPKGGSAGRARNIGLQHAKGKWLLFADSDDFFVENVEDILDKFVDAKEDVVFFNKRTVCSEDITKEACRSSWCEQGIQEYLNTGNETPLRCYHFAPWGKMIKRQLVEDNVIRFDETRYSNDYYFSSCVGIKAKTIAVHDIPIYVVTVRNGSLTDNMYTKPGEVESRSYVMLKVHSLFYANKYPVDFNTLYHHLQLLRNIQSGMIYNYINGIHKLGVRYIDIIYKVFPDYNKCNKVKLFFKSVFSVYSEKSMDSFINCKERKNG